MEDFVVYKSPTPLCVIKDGEITEINLSQSFAKSIFFKWEYREDACGWKVYNLNVARKYRYPQSIYMLYGNYFESKILGGGAYSKTLDLPRNIRTGDLKADQERIDQAVERFWKFAEETGIFVGRNNVQVEKVIPILDPGYPDVKINLKMVADIISPFRYKQIDYPACVIDLKLSKDLDITFQHPYKPWTSFCWGAPEKLDPLQGIVYSEGFNLPFVNLVFDYKPKGASQKVVPVKSIVSHPADQEAKLRHLEYITGVKKVIAQIMEWHSANWPKNNGDWCRKCPVESCNFKTEVDYY